MAYAYENLDKAADLLPASYATQQRPTRGAALGFKARFALCAGDWQTAADAAAQVMNSGVYSLHDNYRALFTADSSPELMFYMILELVSGTRYNAILYQPPIPLEDLKPELYDAIRGIFKQFRIRKKRNVTESTEKTISSAQQPDHPAPLRAAQ